jgi:hypothetical protein
MKDITLKTNDIINIVHHCYFHTYNRPIRLTKKTTNILVKTIYGFPYCTVQ